MCNHSLYHQNGGTMEGMAATMTILSGYDGVIDGHRSIQGFAEDIEAEYGDAVQISVTHATRIGRIIKAIKALIARGFLEFRSRTKQLVMTAKGRKAFERFALQP